MVEPKEDNGMRRRSSDGAGGTVDLNALLAEQLVRQTQEALELAATRVKEEINHLRQYYDTLLSEVDKRYEQRFDASQKALQETSIASKEAVSAAFDASKEAVLKSEVAQEKRNDATFVTVSRLGERLDLLIPRLEADARFKDHDRRFEEIRSLLGTVQAGLASAVTGSTQRREGGAEMKAGLIASVGLVVYVLTIIGLVVGLR